jgi:hypothetical protein
MNTGFVITDEALLACNMRKLEQQHADFTGRR